MQRGDNSRVEATKAIARVLSSGVSLASSFLLAFFLFLRLPAERKRRARNAIVDSSIEKENLAADDRSPDLYHSRGQRDRSTRGKPEIPISIARFVRTRAIISRTMESPAFSASN